MKNLHFKKYVCTSTALIFFLQQVSPVFAMETDSSYAEKRTMGKPFLDKSHSASDTENPSFIDKEQLNAISHQLTRDKNQYLSLFEAVEEDTFKEINEHISNIDYRVSNNMVQKIDNDNQPVFDMGRPVLVVKDEEMDKILKSQRKTEEKKLENIKEIINEVNKKELCEAPIFVFEEELPKGSVFDDIVNMIMPSTGDDLEESLSYSTATSDSEIDKEIDIEDDETRDKKELEIRKYIALIKRKKEPKAEQYDIFNNIAIELMKEMRAIKEAFNDLCGNLVLLIGETGAGKTTLANWLTDQKMIAIKNPGNSRQFILDVDSRNLSGIVYGVQSGTTRPGLWKNSQENITYVDCPGFGDTRGVLKKIKNALYINELFRNPESIKFLIAEPAVFLKMIILAEPTL